METQSFRIVGMNQTPLDQAIDAAASQNAGKGIAHLATACGVSKQFIHKMRREWRTRGCPPKAMREYAARIESATSGVVQAEQLCPDVQWVRDTQGAITGYVVPVEMKVA